MLLFIMQSNIHLINYKTSYMHYSELPFNFGLLAIYTYILLACKVGSFNTQLIATIALQPPQHVFTCDQT
jgi:hypothetical protein